MGLLADHHSYFCFGLKEFVLWKTQHFQPPKRKNTALFFISVTNIDPFPQCFSFCNSIFRAKIWKLEKSAAQLLTFTLLFCLSPDSSVYQAVLSDFFGSHLIQVAWTETKACLTVLNNREGEWNQSFLYCKCVPCPKLDWPSVLSVGLWLVTMTYLFYLIYVVCCCFLGGG